MQFCSTRNGDLRVGLREAVLRGMPGDGGLFMPVSLPRLEPFFLQGLRGRPFPKVAAAVARELFNGDVGGADLDAITAAAFNFTVPLAILNDNVQVLELFHGPTLAFKDFGSRFQARLMAHFLGFSKKPLRILVATSGDTGSAVASGFFRVMGIEVVILYPAGRISALQESQIATWGENIRALEIGGSFDDCQRLVKAAFADPEVGARLRLSTANSINVARLLPQTFYYFYAWSQLAPEKRSLAISVPSGNFGNLTAGLFARRMGLPIDRFVAATNVNDVVPEYLKSGRFQPRPSRQTISSAMDVGDPSNFERLLHLCGGDPEALRRDLFGRGYRDDETRAVMRSVHERSGYVLDPHSAVAVAGLETFLSIQGPGWRGVALATAHPGKFPETVEPVIGSRIEIPDALRQAKMGEKRSIALSNRFEDFKDFLLALDG